MAGGKFREKRVFPPARVRSPKAGGNLLAARPVVNHAGRFFRMPAVMAKANGQNGILPFRERGSGGNDGLYQSTSAMTCLVMSAFLLYPRVSSAAMTAAT